MRNLIRTSITIPEDIYRQAKILAANTGQSFSSFVVRVLVGSIKGRKDKKEISNPFTTTGVFSLGVKKIYRKRSDLYDKFLKRKMGI